MAVENARMYCIVFQTSLVALVHIHVVALIFNNRYNQ